MDWMLILTLVLVGWISAYLILDYYIGGLMASYVTGYMSEDGVFFTTQTEAEKHDFEMAIRAGCASLTHPVKADTFIVTLEALADQCWGYLSAYRKINKQEEFDQTAENSSKPDRN